MHTIQGEGFEWEAARARASLRRHGVDFADAVGVFEDGRALTMPDELKAMDQDEHRLLALGRDTLGQVVVVAYARRGRLIRIVSARHATRRERRQYLEGPGGPKAR